MKKDCKAKKGFEIIDHPSDTGIKAWAEDLKELFAQCALAMFSIICNKELVEARSKKAVNIVQDPSATLEDMLILWLEKLLYLHEVKKLLFSSFKVCSLEIENDHAVIRACAYGEIIDTGRHEIFTSIKAPTYQMLTVKKNFSSGLWEAFVIFDV